jgi:hypothetical protein
MAKGFITSRKNVINIGTDIVRKLIIVAFITLIAGPAIADQNVNFLYHPTALGSGGSGDIYLSQGIQPVSGRPQVEWIIGGIKNGSGEKTGNVVTGRLPVDTLMDAFSQELKGAGYNVIPVETLPDKVEKGIRLTTVSIGLDEIDRIYKVEAKCNVKVSLEVWRNGINIKKLDYESSYEDSTFLDREMILLKAEQAALEQLMARAVREAILLIEQK